MRIEIPKPCTADWDKMKIGLRSRHCESCAKNVVDFRGQSKAEILLYLIQNRGTQTCGRFTKSQLDVIHLEEMITISALRQLPKNKAFAVLTVACLLLASCNSATIESEVIAQKDSVVLAENVILNDSIISDTTHISSHTKATCQKPLKTDSLEPKWVEIEMGEVEIMGDVPELLPNDSLAILEPQIPIHSSTEDTTIYTFTEVMPEFPGGMDKLFSFLREHVNYPEHAKTDGVGGKIYAFIIFV